MWHAPTEERNIWFDFLRKERDRPQKKKTSWRDNARNIQRYVRQVSNISGTQFIRRWKGGGQKRTAGLKMFTKCDWCHLHSCLFLFEWLENERPEKEFTWKKKLEGRGADHHGTWHFQGNSYRNARNKDSRAASPLPAIPVMITRWSCG